MISPVLHDTGQPRPRLALLVNGVPGVGKSTLAVQLSDGLDLPLLSKDAVKETLLDELGFDGRDGSRRLRAAAGEVVWSILADCPGGGIVDSWLATDIRDVVRAGLTRARIDLVVEIWCSAPPPVVRHRVKERSHRRHTGHFDNRAGADLERWLETAAPLALGPVITVDTSRPIDTSELLEQIGEYLRRRPQGPAR